MTVYYVDPTRPDNSGDGLTPAAAKKTWAGLAGLWAAGNEYRQKRGTTAAEQVTVGATGTSDSVRVILGSYYNSDGSDDDSQPRPIINGSTTSSIYATGRNYITIMDLEAGDGSVASIRLNNSGGLGNQILRCVANGCSGSEAGIYAAGQSNDLIVMDNEALNCTAKGSILLTHQNASGATGWRIERNNASGNITTSSATNAGAGIKIATSGGVAGSYTDGAIVTGNTCSNNGLLMGSTGANDGGFGIWISESYRTRVNGNTCNYNRSNGIEVLGSAALTAALNVKSTGCQIVGNTCTYNGQYGIFSATNNNLYIAGNNCSYNGGNICAATNQQTAGYGRGIELYSTTLANACSGAVIGNTCNYNRMSSVPTPGIHNFSEGVGIGADAHSSNMLIAYNTCKYNESAGIEVAGSTGSANVRVISNLLVGNCTQASDSGTDSDLSGLPYSPQYATLRIYGSSITGVEIVGNTIICENAKEKYGISTNYSSAGTGYIIHNNAIVGAAVAALCAYRTNITNVLTNQQDDCPETGVTTTNLGATKTAQASTGIAALADTLRAAADYRPDPGAAVYGAGTQQARYWRDIDRVQRPNPPSIGAYDLPTNRRVFDSDPATW